MKIAIASVPALVALAAPAVAASGDAAAIRAVRAETNAAIAAHDPDRLMAAFADDYVIVSGNGGAHRGAEDVRAFLGQTFARPGLVDYVRTPREIRVSTAGPRASERGDWTGRWRTQAGATAMRGSYLAHWVKAAGAWRIRAEIFVTLACDGPDC